MQIDENTSLEDFHRRSETAFLAHVIAEIKKQAPDHLPDMILDSSFWPELVVSKKLLAENREVRLECSCEGADLVTVRCVGGDYYDIDHHPANPLTPTRLAKEILEILAQLPDTA